MLLENVELVQTAESIAEEKGIEKELVFQAIEKAISKAGKVKYGNDYDIRGSIDRKTGKISLARYQEVKKDVEDTLIEITLKDAKKKRKDIKIGEFIIEQLPDIDIGRISAQMAKQVLVQNIKEAESVKNYGLYKDKIGETISGIVKRMEFGNIVIDLSNAEAVIKKDEIIPRENLRRGDRVKAYLYNVNQDTKGPQIFLSRTHPQFLANLFKQEVPEINDGVIEIKSVARDPGSRAKIAVYSTDATIDPVGACVGMRGSRVQAVVNELQGEKIDIVTWSENQATFLANALAPAEVSKIFLYEEKNKVEVVIPDEQLSLAIGRKGQNVKLASALTNLEIDILTEEEESERRQQEFKDKSTLLSEILDVEDVIAQLLVTEGYVSVDSIAAENLENIEKIEGFDNDLASEIISRAKNYLEELEQSNLKLVNEKIKDEDLKNIEGMTVSMLALLVKENILTLNDFAELATFELIDKEEGILKSLEVEEELANKMIMEARKSWFE